MALFTHQKILVQELAVDDIEKEIMHFINDNNIDQISFSDYLKKVDELKLSQQYIVTCFSALLELVKYRKINLTQNDMNDDILISKNIQFDEMQDSLIKE
jgi:chromatin segregation and condensation protein Rec8/ScpA/Scc1 (kleisin family)